MSRKHHLIDINIKNNIYIYIYIYMLTSFKFDKRQESETKC